MKRPLVPWLTGVAGLVVTLGGAAGVLYQWSPFAWAWEVRQLAQETYETAIWRTTSELLQVRFLLAQAQSTGDQTMIQFLEAREAELQRDLGWFLQEQARVQGGQ